MVCFICGAEKETILIKKKYFCFDCCNVCQVCGQGYKKSYTRCPYCFGIVKSIEKYPLLVCGICGKEFRKTRYNRKYCSIKCTHKANDIKDRKPLVTKKCIICGEEFILPDGFKKNVCSKKCRYKMDVIKNNKRHREASSKIHNFCIICGKEIKRGSAKFCSPECIKTNEERLRGNCIVCGKQLPYHRSKYCSEECWPLKRDRFIILERDNFQCIYCGVTSVVDKVRLEVDHIVPRCMGGSNYAENLVTACQRCNVGRSKSFLSNQEIILGEVAKRNEEAGIPNKLIIKIEHGD